MLPPEIAKRLTHQQREMLLRHIDGEARIIQYPTSVYQEQLTRLSLVKQRLLRHSRLPGTAASLRPTHTSITPLGREVLCALLASMAEQLLSAGFEVSVPVRLRSHMSGADWPADSLRP